MELTEEEKEHIKIETKQFVTCAGFCEYGSSAALQRAKEAGIKKHAAAAARRISDLMERWLATG